MIDGEIALRRNIIISGEIDDKMAGYVCARLLDLASESYDPIFMCINSHTGSVSAGTAIISTMTAIQIPIYTICLDSAIGISAVILAAGSKNKRLCVPDAKLCFHKVPEDLMDKYVQNDENRLDTSVYLSTEEAQKQGIIDSVTENWFYARDIREKRIAREKFYNSEIDELDLSVRAYNILRLNGIHTVAQFMETDAYDLEKLHNCGVKTLEEYEAKKEEINKKFSENS